MSGDMQDPGQRSLGDPPGSTLAPVCRKDVPVNRNLKLEPVVAVPVRALPAEPPQPEPRVLAHVLEDGYRQRIVGRASDLPATLAWLEERGG